MPSPFSMPFPSPPTPTSPGAGTGIHFPSSPPGYISFIPPTTTSIVPTAPMVIPPRRVSSIPAASTPTRTAAPTTSIVPPTTTMYTAYGRPITPPPAEHTFVPSTVRAPRRRRTLRTPDSVERYFGGDPSVSFTQFGGVSANAMSASPTSMSPNNGGGAGAAYNPGQYDGGDGDGDGYGYPVYDMVPIPGDPDAFIMTLQSNTSPYSNNSSFQADLQRNVMQIFRSGGADSDGTVASESASGSASTSASASVDNGREPPPVWGYGSISSGGGSSSAGGDSGVQPYPWHDAVRWVAAQSRWQQQGESEDVRPSGEDFRDTDGDTRARPFGDEMPQVPFVPRIRTAVPRIGSTAGPADVPFVPRDGSASAALRRVGSTAATTTTLAPISSSPAPSAPTTPAQALASTSSAPVSALPPSPPLAAASNVDPPIDSSLAPFEPQSRTRIRDIERHLDVLGARAAALDTAAANMRAHIEALRDTSTSARPVPAVEGGSASAGTGADMQVQQGSASAAGTAATTTRAGLLREARAELREAYARRGVPAPSAVAQDRASAAEESAHNVRAAVMESFMRRGEAQAQTALEERGSGVGAESEALGSTSRPVSARLRAARALVAQERETQALRQDIEAQARRFRADVEAEARRDHVRSSPSAPSTSTAEEQVLREDVEAQVRRFRAEMEAETNYAFSPSARSVAEEQAHDARTELLVSARAAIAGERVRLSGMQERLAALGQQGRASSLPVSSSAPGGGAGTGAAPALAPIAEASAPAPAAPSSPASAPATSPPALVADIRALVRDQTALLARVGSLIADMGARVGVGLAAVEGGAGGEAGGASVGVGSGGGGVGNANASAAAASMAMSMATLARARETLERADRTLRRAGAGSAPVSTSASVSPPERRNAERAPRGADSNSDSRGTDMDMLRVLEMEREMEAEARRRRLVEHAYRNRDRDRSGGAPSPVDEEDEDKRPAATGPRRRTFFER
ncbi:hypothetical protein K438DRAFT_1931047 [Mycena galopus ATCC 62051]|nr:hypothetical protein K438DRAFT_1931047 [Mycena galopus ATCC 62051]